MCIVFTYKTGASMLCATVLVTILSDAERKYQQSNVFVHQSVISEETHCFFPADKYTAIAEC